MPAAMTPPERLGAAELRAALEVAQRWLELNREAINAINVYPVPDGDTGTNMLLTLRAALRATLRSAEQDRDDAAAGVAGLADALAEGALLGARGNSGVILSQMLRGFAEGLAGCAELGAGELCTALARASSAAYEAVGDPVEGTMLTVLREAASGAADALVAAPSFEPSLEPPLGAVLAATVAAATASVARTPELLPQLREAGVVDAGGEGVAVLLEGLRCGVTGEPLPAAPETPAGAVALDGVGHEGHGFCVEYLVRGEDLERGALLGVLEARGGESLLVVGDAHALHVHVHVPEPEGALADGARLGTVENVKVDDMQAQHEAWAADHERAALAPRDTPGEAPAVGLVAVVQGDGLRAAFRDLGATAIVDGGATNNPSAGQLLEAARRAGTEHAFILPNDSNVVLTAHQAAGQDPARITVIPARSVVAGLASAIAFVPDDDLEALAARLTEAAAAVRSVEVTHSVRDTTVDGLAVRTGEAIALVDGRLVATAATLEEALLAGLAHAVEEGSELVSIYLGADAPADAAEQLPARIEAAHPGIAVEVVLGGQPHYPYLAGIE